MEEKDKIWVKRIFNDKRYNELDIEKSAVFLERLQDFVVDAGLAKVREGEYVVDGKSYDMKTFYTLFYEDEENDFMLKEKKIGEFRDGEVARYFNEDVELLIIFLENKIKLIFYCDLERRDGILDALFGFCRF